MTRCPRRQEVLCLCGRVGWGVVEQGKDDVSAEHPVLVMCLAEAPEGL